MNTPDGVVKTSKRDLIRNLDDLPLPNWRLFGNRHSKGSYIAPLMGGVESVAAIESSRGCPFTCSYCSNEALMAQYAGQGPWRREKSPERIVEELEAFRRAGPVHNAAAAKGRAAAWLERLDADR